MGNRNDRSPAERWPVGLVPAETPYGLLAHGGSRPACLMTRPRHVDHSRLRTLSPTPPALRRLYPARPAPPRLQSVSCETTSTASICYSQPMLEYETKPIPQPDTSALRHRLSGTNTPRAAREILEFRNRVEKS